MVTIVQESEGLVTMRLTNARDVTSALMCAFSRRRAHVAH